MLSPRVSPRVPSAEWRLAIYQVLHDRYVCTTGLQWQVAVYTIAAQAALLVGAFTAPASSAAVWLLGAAVMAVGILGALVARRIELTAWLDREHLDELERVIAGDYALFRLHHGDTFIDRLDRRGLHVSQRSRIRRLDLWVTRLLPPGAALAVVMTLLGCVGLVAAIAR